MGIFLYVFISCILLLSGCAVKQGKVEVVPATVIYPREEYREPRGVYHKVGKGETLYRIAKAYGVQMSKIIEANRIEDPSLIKEGQLLFIPGAEQRVAVLEEGFIWPVEGEVVSGFGSHTKRGENKGIDIRASGDCIVRAVKSGIVCFAGEHIKGYGEVIIIDHGENLYSLYAYNSKIFVKKGDYVRQGQNIAELDPQNPILHFELRRGHRAIDPLKYLP